MYDFDLLSHYTKKVIDSSKQRKRKSIVCSSGAIGVKVADIISKELLSETRSDVQDLTEVDRQRTVKRNITFKQYSELTIHDTVRVCKWTTAGICSPSTPRFFR